MSSSDRNTVVPLYFNSKDRLDIDDSTADYKLRLRKTLRNISSLEVSNTGIPKTYTNIGINNNVLLLIFHDNSTESQIQIDLESKNYTTELLASTLEELLNENPVSVELVLTWLVTYDNVTNKFYIDITYPNGVNSSSWGVDVLFTALVDVIGIGGGGTTTKIFRSETGNDHLVIAINRNSNLSNNININITSTALTADINTSYIKSLGKSFNITSENDIFSLISTKSLNNFTRVLPLGTGTTSGSRFGGLDIAMSGDGSTIISGARGDSDFKGAVATFKKITNGTQWLQRTPKLVSTLNNRNGFFGQYLDMSKDGTTIAVVCPVDFVDNTGSDFSADSVIYIYTKSGLYDWSLQDRLTYTVIDTINTSTTRGVSSVALSNNGDTLASLWNYGGRNRGIRIFTRTNRSWSLQELIEEYDAGATSVNRTYGRTVISADGNTIMVSDPSFNTNIGNISMYTRDITGKWNKSGISLSPTDNIGPSTMGMELAISVDSIDNPTYLETLVAGGPGDDSNNGAAWVFVRDGTFNGNWVLEQKITPNNTGKRMGRVAISNDGNIMALSTYIGRDVSEMAADSYRNGEVEIWRRDPPNIGGTWVWEATVTPEYTDIDESIPWSTEEPFPSTSGVKVGPVALNGSGDVIAFAGEGFLNDTGAMWVKKRESIGNWVTVQGPTFMDDANGESLQTSNIKISKDSNLMLSGGPIDSYKYGAAWFFYREGKEWYQIGDKITAVFDNPGSDEEFYLGTGVAISKDGGILALGAPGVNDDQGCVLIYEWDKNINKSPYLIQQIYVPDNIGTAQVGYSIALSYSGDVLAIAGPYDDTDKGAVWIYNKINNTYVYQTKLIGTTDIPGGIGWQGHSVTLNEDGTVLVVGGTDETVLVPTDSRSGSYSDKHTIWIWVYSNNSWVESQRESEGTASSVTRFGSGDCFTSVDVSADGNVIIFGAPRYKNDNPQPGYNNVCDGAVVLYQRIQPNNNWVKTDIPRPSYGINYNLYNHLIGVRFGHSVSITQDGMTIIIGDTLYSSYTGALLLFKRDNVNSNFTYEDIIEPNYENLHITRSLGNSCSVTNLINSSDYILVSGTKGSGGFHRISKLDVNENVTINITNRAFTIFDLVNELNKKFTLDDISYESNFDEESETLSIVSIDNYNVTSVFTIDTASTFLSVINFINNNTPTNIQISLDIDFTINNNIIKQIDSHEDENGTVIYNIQPELMFRKYRAGFTLENTDIIDIQLRDERDRIIDLNGADWNMTIYATIHN